MKALSIWQPWAWLIVAGIKDIENRGWSTSYRGPLLIQAGKKVDAEAMSLLPQWAEEDGFELPDLSELRQGGIVGVTRLCNIISDSESPWAAEGKQHWVLRSARELPFTPWQGQQGLFDIPYDLVSKSIVRTAA